MKWNWTKAAPSALPGRIHVAGDTDRQVSGYAHDLIHQSLAAAAKHGHMRIECELEGCTEVSGNLVGTDSAQVEMLIGLHDTGFDEEAGKPAAERPIEPHRRYLYPAPPKWWDSQTFETFEADAANGSALEVARAWSAEPAGVLVFLGPTGTGKTHLAAAITHRAIADGRDASVWEFDAWVDAVRDVFAVNDRNEVKAFEHRMVGAELLVLDEIRAEATSDAVRDIFELIVRQRTGHERPLLITTNANDESWQAWSQRAYSRLRNRQYATWVPMIGQDRRVFAA